MKRPRTLVADQAPLDPERLFAGLDGAGGVVLAVSGGPDSTALMVLFSRLKRRPAALVVTVDHGLRPEARDEARAVTENAARLGLPCRVMRTPPRPATGNLQDWARQARYRSLAEAARTAGFDTLLTAHHQDDQAETFLLRLARGSGAYGLGGISEASTFEGLRLLRPLLGVPRAALARVAEESGLPLADDPGNRDDRFHRVRMRAMMPVLAAQGLTTQRLAETAGRLRRAADALDHYAELLLRGSFKVDEFGSLHGPVSALGEVPREIGLRALALIFRAVGGAEYTPRLDRLESMLDALLATGPTGHVGRTLHGVEILAERGRLLARREWGRRQPEPMAAPVGGTLLWDRRFRVAVPDWPEPLLVAPIGDREHLLHASADRQSLRMLPALYAGPQLVGIPETGVGTKAGAGPLRRFAAECIVADRLGLSGAKNTTAH